MAFTFKNEGGTGRLAGGTHELKGKETIDWLFHSDNKDDTSLELYANKDAVRIGDNHPVYQWMQCVDLHAIQGSDKEWNRWVLRAFYERKEDPFTPASPSKPPTRTTPPEEVPGEDPDFDEKKENPEFRAHVSVTFEEFAKPLGAAYSSSEAATRAFKEPIKPTIGIVNSALWPYDPPPNISEQLAIIDIRGNILTTSSLFRDLNFYRNAINLDGFKYIEGKFELKVPKRCGRLRFTMGPTMEYVDTRDGVRRFYREINIQIVVDERTWLVRPLDYGPHYVDTAETRYTIQQRIDDDNWVHQTDAKFPTFVDEDGNPSFGLLDGKGDKLGEDSPPVFNEYKGYKEDFFLPLLTKVSSQKFKVL